MTQGEVTGRELQVRKAVLRRLLRGERVDLAVLGANTRLPGDEVARALSKLNELGAIHIMEGVLVAAYPLSGGAHGIGSAAIESDCAHCGKETTLQMNADRVPGGVPGFPRRVSRGAGLL